jgi:predicted AlkP superfamily pyrophosphatase or phosphodiesterase
MKKFILLPSLFVFAAACSQKNVPVSIGAKYHRPKLVIGIVVDQMRWDFLYRFYDVYKEDGGFKKLINRGFSCDNAFIPYTPTVTAAGHTCVYTGSVPALHGIISNEWYDKQTHSEVYCTEDSSVTVVGSENKKAGAMSPRNMWASTITDELRLATNFQSKTVGIAIKDRGAILPAGHTANGAYWYDSKSGKFITSSYYNHKDLPDWVKHFNDRKIVDSLYALDWNLFLTTETYPKYCDNDNVPYERKIAADSNTAFPHLLRSYIGKDYGKISFTPYGNTLTLEMSKAAILGEQMGKSGYTDFLAVSLSSPDYAGHSFGPNSWELLDMYARLDREIGNFLDFLDKQVGENQYIVFLTADHGVAHIPGFLKEHRMPHGLINDDIIKNKLNSSIFKSTGLSEVVEGIYNYQVYLNEHIMDSAEADLEAISDIVVQTLLSFEGVQMAFPLKEISEAPLPSAVREMILNGYSQTRSGHVQYIPKPAYIDGFPYGTTHGLWNPYDAHIPLIFYGWQIQHGKTNESVFMTDIAPTLAALLHIQMPNTSIGRVVSMP